MAKHCNNKGVAMIMVLGTILVVVVLANVILAIILSQSRLTRHQIGRIQAYYAAMAGINYTLEQLRTGTWNAGETHAINFAAGDFYPSSLVGNSVTVVITQAQNTNANQPCFFPDNRACVSVTADYQYQ